MEPKCPICNKSEKVREVVEDKTIATLLKEGRSGATGEFLRKREFECLECEHVFKN